MNCDEFVERITDYFEDALARTDQERADDHLELCRGCNAYIGEMIVTLRLVAALPVEPPSVQLESALIEQYQEWARSA
jgi:predicted anti-sigma-YlaC factor YlaD